jgi:methanethiol S-methyltransferase
MPATRTVSPATVAFAWSGGLLFLVSQLYFAYSYGVWFGEPARGADVIRPLLVNLLLFSIFALHHSALARSGTKQRLQQFIPAPVERATYTWIASVLFLLTCTLWQPVPGEVYRFEGPASTPGYLVQVVGVILTIRGARALDVLDLAGVRPALDARDGHEPRHVPLNTNGLYGFVRHPLYFAWMLMVFGAPHMTATRLSFAVISTLYLAAAIPFEERSLIDTFDGEYRAYQRKVKYRMIPGVW